jgi:hypothetical protein
MATVGTLFGMGYTVIDRRIEFLSSDFAHWKQQMGKVEGWVESLRQMQSSTFVGFQSALDQTKQSIDEFQKTSETLKLWLDSERSGFRKREAEVNSLMDDQHKMLSALASKVEDLSKTVLVSKGKDQRYEEFTGRVSEMRHQLLAIARILEMTNPRDARIKQLIESITAADRNN